MESLLITVLGGAFGGLVGFTSAWRLQSAQNLHNRTIALFDEFNSPGMLAARLQVADLLDGAASANLYELFQKARSAKDKSTEEVIQALLTYFEKVVKLCDLKLADRRILKGLMGRYFAYWHERAFGDLVIEGVEHAGWKELLSISSQIKDLRADAVV